MYFTRGYMFHTRNHGRTRKTMNYGVGKGIRISDGGVVDVLQSKRYQNYEPFILGSQADQVCYLSYLNTKQPRKTWLSICKVNPRNVVQGKFTENDMVILQQSVDEAPPSMIEEVIVESLVDGNHQDEPIDFDIEDAEGEDEFHCNSSTSEDEDEEEGEDEE
ncbi:uncharacterized protein LOC110229804 isoform X2 [Arabidopsis lyrata subsp. lyrata]|uniref:uncharacterized protein LOC110229804 isoform X2 n=1 Tax=Arabidopsis lyrata subsp. lyrata TaxID=81972 RepID=UPI000A29BAFF|nr:uncharacterized protein LOC110229804 isoform X2 [Arabidopsis lyrata subsp. lyrata]|eukprot:XP_020886398.1 uncharacterized protein LOC110229804 isoform X2 [Arabidopsis lyrata subsp. lyrata]